MYQFSLHNFEQSHFKRAFTPQEDERLRQLVAIYGDREWKLVAQKMPNRTTRQCRERYKSYLAPDIKNGPWTPEEDELLKQKYKEYGSKWSSIQSFFRSRSDVNIKNRWTIISGRMHKEPKMKAYLINPNQNSSESMNSSSSAKNPTIKIKGNQDTIKSITLNNDNNNNMQTNSPLSIQQNQIKILNSNKSPILSPISPSSPSILAQISPPGISNPIPTSNISFQKHNITQDQDKIPHIYHIHQKTTNSESINQIFISLHNQDHFHSSNLPQYKKQKPSQNELAISSVYKKAADERNITVNKIQPPNVKKQIFPPISSLSMPSDDRLMIVDKLFSLPNETRIDESIITSGPNLTLANNFPHYGGNIW